MYVLLENSLEKVYSMIENSLEKVRFESGD